MTRRKGAFDRIFERVGSSNYLMEQGNKSMLPITQRPAPLIDRLNEHFKPSSGWKPDYTPDEDKIKLVTKSERIKLVKRTHKAKEAYDPNKGFFGVFVSDVPESYRDQLLRLKCKGIADENFRGIPHSCVMTTTDIEEARKTADRLKGIGVGSVRVMRFKNVPIDVGFLNLEDIHVEFQEGEMSTYIPELKKFPDVQPSMWYVGKELFYQESYPDELLDDAQVMIDYYRRHGREASCLHRGYWHDLYVERKPEETSEQFGEFLAMGAKRAGQRVTGHIKEAVKEHIPHPLRGQSKYTLNQTPEMYPEPKNKFEFLSNVFSHLMDGMSDYKIGIHNESASEPMDAIHDIMADGMTKFGITVYEVDVIAPQLDDLHSMMLNDYPTEEVRQQMMMVADTIGKMQNNQLVPPPGKEITCPYCQHKGTNFKEGHVQRTHKKVYQCPSCQAYFHATMVGESEQFGEFIAMGAMAGKQLIGGMRKGVMAPPSKESKSDYIVELIDVTEKYRSHFPDFMVVKQDLWMDWDSGDWLTTKPAKDRGRVLSVTPLTLVDVTEQWLRSGKHEIVGKYRLYDGKETAEFTDTDVKKLLSSGALVIEKRPPPTYYEDEQFGEFIALGAAKAGQMLGQHVRKQVEAPPSPPPAQSKYDASKTITLIQKSYVSPYSGSGAKRIYYVPTEESAKILYDMEDVVKVIGLKFQMTKEGKPYTDFTSLGLEKLTSVLTPKGWYIEIINEGQSKYDQSKSREYRAWLLYEGGRVEGVYKSWDEADRKATEYHTKGYDTMIFPEYGEYTLIVREPSKSNQSELEIRIVPDEACPECGAYWGNPNKNLDFPNRPKVGDELGRWWWKCYNPKCKVGYYLPETRQVEYDSDKIARIQKGVEDEINKMTRRIKGGESHSGDLDFTYQCIKDAVYKYKSMDRQQAINMLEPIKGMIHTHVERGDLTEGDERQIEYELYELMELFKEGASWNSVDGKWLYIADWFKNHGVTDVSPSHGESEMEYGLAPGVGTTKCWRCGAEGELFEVQPFNMTKHIMVCGDCIRKGETVFGQSKHDWTQDDIMASIDFLSDMTKEDWEFIQPLMRLFEKNDKEGMINVLMVGTEAQQGLFKRFVHAVVVLKDTGKFDEILKEAGRSKYTYEDMQGAIAGEGWAINDYGRMLSTATPEQREVLQHIQNEEKDHLKELLLLDEGPYGPANIKKWEELTGDKMGSPGGAMRFTEWVNKNYGSSKYEVQKMSSVASWNSMNVDDRWDILKRLVDNNVIGLFEAEEYKEQDWANLPFHIRKALSTMVSSESHYIPMKPIFAPTDKRAQRLKEKFEAQGYKVIITRSFQKGGGYFVKVLPGDQSQAGFIPGGGPDYVLKVFDRDSKYATIHTYQHEADMNKAIQNYERLGFITQVAHRPARSRQEGSYIDGDILTCPADVSRWSARYPDATVIHKITTDEGIVIIYEIPAGSYSYAKPKVFPDELRKALSKAGVGMPDDDLYGLKPSTIWAGNLAWRWASVMVPKADLPSEDIEYVAVAMFQKLKDARTDWEAGRKAGIKKYAQEAIAAFKKEKPLLAPAKPTGEQVTLPFVEVRKEVVEHPVEAATMLPPKQKPMPPPFEMKLVTGETETLEVGAPPSGPIVLVKQSGGRRGRPTKAETAARAPPAMSNRVVADKWVETFIHDANLIPIRTKTVLDHLASKTYDDDTLGWIYKFAESIQRGKPLTEDNVKAYAKKALEELGEVLPETATHKKQTR